MFERQTTLALTARAAVLAGSAWLAGCGGGPFDNPPDVSNPPGSGESRLSYAYYQRCVFPVLLAELPIDQNGQISINTCAGAGCHDDATGAGGALRVIRTATPLLLGDPANTPEVIMASDMYKNFYSSFAMTIPGDSLGSRLLTKPLLADVLHGGGKVFESVEDPNAAVIAYWIDHPMPSDQDEFGPAANRMFTPPDPDTGTCKTR